MAGLLSLLFGCSHSNYSFPQTPKGQRKPQAAALTGTYVVCTDCGKEFPYDWNTMKIVTEVPATSTTVLALEEK